MGNKSDGSDGSDRSDKSDRSDRSDSSDGSKRPVAFIQVDLDGLWAVRRCYGLTGSPEQDDPVYSEALPRLLELFGDLGLPATFFVVGADARVEWKRRLLEAVKEAGHEIANHSMNHPLEGGGLEGEAAACQQTLREALGVEPRGFRAPGFAWSPHLPGELVRQGFWYDASVLPTRWAFVLRWIDRRISSAPVGKRWQYGRRQGQAWVLPQVWRKDSAVLWEIPVSVSYHLQLPFHGGIGYMLGSRWVQRAIGALARRRGFLNYVIHGMDLVDGRKWPVTECAWGRRFFAGSERERLDFFAKTCRHIAAGFEVFRTDRWVEKARTGAENH